MGAWRRRRRMWWRVCGRMIGGRWIVGGRWRRLSGRWGGWRRALWIGLLAREKIRRQMCT